MSNNEMTTNVFVQKTTNPVFCTSYPFRFIMGFTPEKSTNWTPKTKIIKDKTSNSHETKKQSDFRCIS